MKPEKILPKRISRALMEYAMIDRGDRVLLAVSGGKDSLAMAWFMSRMASSFPLPFSVEAAHVKAPWQDPDLSAAIGEICGEWKIPCRELPLVPEDKEMMTCALCARYRRRALLEHASREGFDSVALGHHMEDGLETFLVNMVYHSRLDALLPRRDYPVGGGRTLKLIRPLILAQENTVEKWISGQDIIPVPSHCPWESTDSRRKEMRTHMEELTGGSASKKRNMFMAAVSSFAL